MSLRLETRGLSKIFGSFAAVSDVSLSFDPGLIHAVLGENGAGKSTLMKLLFGLERPSAGEIVVDGQAFPTWKSATEAIARGFGMVQQHFSLVESLSVIDNIMLGAEPMASLGRVNRDAAVAKIEKVLPGEGLRLPWHRLVSELTVGDKQKVEILKLLFRDSKLLFLDEPTAVLTPVEIEEFFGVLRELKSQGRTIIFITHKINEVMSVCDTFSVLRQGRVAGQGAVRKSSADDIVELMIGRKLDPLTIDVADRSQDQPALECVGLRGRAGVRGRLDGASLHVNHGEIVGVAGVAGSGQSHLVESIFGLREFAGELKVLGQNIKPLQTAIVRSLGVGLVPEDRLQQGLWLEGSCHMNMVIGLEDRFLKSHIFQFDQLRAETQQWARDFDVRAPSLETPAGSLSGGNQQKLIFAREVSGRTPQLLICHQPTRGVDLGAIDLIHRRLLKLRNEGLGVLVLSSELDELLKICDRLYVFFEGQVAAEFKRGEFDRLKIGAAMAGVTHGA